ncbi:MAG: aminopeptidase P family protein [Anaerolineae bacterium]|uniref:M24 family metallopeptidase n=1 Tax=Candidatus Amarolinea dominans TaxID=3140696 RepID=UPI003136E7B8|nr:aminopeptidase P family protein [Anaerolineae bacterium]
MSERLTRLRAASKAHELDACLINEANNRRYLSGFTGSNGWLFITADSATLITDGRYIEQAGRECPGFAVIKIARGEDVEGFRRLLEPFLHKRVALESDQVTLEQWRRWFQPLEVDWAFTTGLVAGLRSQKEAGELAAIQAAAQLADATMAYAYTVAKPGMTEAELAWRLEVYLHEHGAHGPAFEIIVASGPNSALPHARPTERPIEAGEPLTIDLGARLPNGYHSDLTRTFCLGQPTSDTFHAVYQAVAAAHRHAAAHLRPGLIGAEADRLARAVIEQAGFGDKFVHSLGHGVGLAVHEQPSLGPQSQDVLQVGNVVTVEPGIYLPGWGGVRIEDLFFIRADGAQWLSHAQEIAVQHHDARTDHFHD